MLSWSSSQIRWWHTHFPEEKWWMIMNVSSVGDEVKVCTDNYSFSCCQLNKRIGFILLNEWCGALYTDCIWKKSLHIKQTNKQKTCIPHFDSNYVLTSKNARNADIGYLKVIYWHYFIKAIHNLVNSFEIYVFVYSKKKKCCLKLPSCFHKIMLKIGYIEHFSKG